MASVMRTAVFHGAAHAGLDDAPVAGAASRRSTAREWEASAGRPGLHRVPKLPFVPVQLSTFANSWRNGR